jgi:Arc/MetJ-type ribon-helix-helix transcriptional regulator
VSTATVKMTELELLHRFVSEQLANGGRRMSVEECLNEFRAYQSELERLREEIRPALERSLRGESRPFDADKLKARVTRELADEGITD